MRRRLVLSIAGVAAAAVVLFAVPLALILGGAHRTSDLLRLQRDTFAATRAIDISSNSDDPIELPPSADQLAAYDLTGRLVAGAGPVAAPAVVRQALRSGRASQQPGGGPLVVAVPLVSGEHVTGAVRAERTEGESAGDTTEQRFAIAALAAGTVLVSVVAALWLGRRLARPLERLSVDADRIGHGDFTVRTPTSGIREVDAVGDALTTTAERLKAMVNRERAFSADASHQLRTPLQALRLQLEAAELRGDAPPETAEALRQVDRLATTITTLLAVARDVPRSASPIDIDAIVEATRERWHGPLAAGSRPLRARATRRRLTAQADTRIVEQILDILLDNALTHGAGTVTISVRTVDRWVAIDVSDEGPGFAADSPDPFQRRTTASDAHGIGLALAQSLAHAEGGMVALTRSAPAPTLTLFLPASEPVAPTCH